MLAADVDANILGALYLNGLMAVTDLIKILGRDARVVAMRIESLHDTGLVQYHLSPHGRFVFLSILGYRNHLEFRRF